MLDLFGNFIEAVTTPFRTKPLLVLDEEFKDGLSRDAFVVSRLLKAYAESGVNNLTTENYITLIAICETSTDEFVNEVVPIILNRAVEANAPLDKLANFFDKHYGDKASVRRVISYYKPKKVEV